MKTITASKAREILKKQWSKLKHIWIFDRKLVLLPPKQIADVLKGIEVHKKQFKEQLFDCDDFALVSNAFVKLKVAELNFPYNWAFGEVFLVDPERGTHNQNIFITEDFKVMLYEPQNNEIIIPTEEIVFYVRI